MRPGQKILIFGEFIPAESAPISIPEPGVVSPIGGTQGLFDVSGNVATARSSEVLATRRVDAERVLRSLEDVASKAQGKDGAEPERPAAPPLGVPLDTIRDLIE